MERFSETEDEKTCLILPWGRSVLFQREKKQWGSECQIPRILESELQTPE